MPLKPQYLKGIESILGAKKIENFVNNVEDFLVIEDETGRIRICNLNVTKTFLPSNFVTGIFCALYGCLTEKGLFNPIDIEYYQINYNSPIKEIQISQVILCSDSKSCTINMYPSIQFIFILSRINF